MDEHELYGGAFILHESGKPIRVQRQSFSTEDEFQELIAKYPELLAGEMVSPDKPRKWLLISREAGIADSESGQDRWAVDHLFVDQEGTPTFVEVKRRTDSRLKRDVVGQILGYVAFATAFLSGKRLREIFEDRVTDDGSDPTEMVQDFLAKDADVESFWNDVDLKMQAGEVRAMVVADAIPRELQRILEFLNERTSGVEILGIELQLYAMDAYRTLVPRVVGITTHAEDRKKAPAPRNWGISDVREGIAQTAKPSAVDEFDQLIAWAENDSRLRIESGTGAKTPSIRIRLLVNGVPCTFLTITPEQSRGLIIMLYLQSLMKERSDLFHLEHRTKLLEGIATNVDPEVDVERVDKYPTFRLVLEDALTNSIELFDMFIEVVER